MAEEKRVLLIIGGGIAAYKSLDLIRRLGDHGIRTRGVLTAAGAAFITPLSVASLTGGTCYSDLFSLTDEAEMGHIRLSREADLVLVAPATADLMAKMATGLANDLASTLLLATDKPVMIAPAMNHQMWRHPATQRNLARLEADGVRVVGPAAGDLACGEVGPGRMAEVADIVDAVRDHFAARKEQPLRGRRALVTAGPTHEAIDPVRYIANRSSGRQGYAIAAALAELGAETILVSGPTTLATPPGVRRIDVECADEMWAAVEAALPVDIAVCVAAVADWRPARREGRKLKKSGDTAPAIALVETPDILARLAARKEDRPALVIGFAAETDHLAEHAAEKRRRKGCDWIVANDVSAAGGAMGGEDNRVLLLTDDGSECWERAPKTAIARRLAARIAAHLAARAG